MRQLTVTNLSTTRLPSLVRTAVHISQYSACEGCVYGPKTAPSLENKTEFGAAQQQPRYHMAQKNPKTSRVLPASAVKYVGASTALQVIPHRHPVLDIVASLRVFLGKKRGFVTSDESICVIVWPGFPLPL